jgi:ribosomal protein S18 acetylase RimI-like enzyme
MKYAKKFRNIFYVYEADNIIAGYLAYYVHIKREGMSICSVATAYSIAVEQDLRGRGICTIMYEESTAQLKRNGVKAIYAYINVKNIPSLATHKKLGFKVIKTIENLYGTDAGYKVELIL